MANPNIVSVTSIVGNTLSAAVLTTATQLASNAASSGKVFKINSIVIANIDGTSAADITEGGHALNKAPGVSFLRTEGQNVVLSVGSGHYEFTMTRAR